MVGKSFNKAVRSGNKNTFSGFKKVAKAGAKDVRWIK